MILLSEAEEQESKRETIFKVRVGRESNPRPML